MQPVTTIEVAEMLLPLLNIFTPHLIFIFSMMIAFAVAKFTKDIMIK